jgi:flagellar basal body-associated protein FliL
MNDQFTLPPAHQKVIIALKFFFVIWMLLSGAAFASSEGEAGGTGGRLAKFVALDPMVINLRDDRFIQLKLQIKVMNVKDVTLVKAYTPVIRFELIKSLIGRNADELQTTTFISAFSETAAALINKTLHDEYVKEVLFDSWLVQ